MSEGQPNIPVSSTPPATPATSATQPGNAATGNPLSGTNAKTTDATPPKEASTPEYFDVKVNGKTVRMTRQEMHDRASMSFAAQQKFDEAAKLRREYDEKHKIYSKDPIQAFHDYANSLPPEQKRKLIEDFYMKEYIEPDSLTAEQRKLREYETRFKKQEEEEQQRKLKEQKENEDQLTQKQREVLQQEIVEMMDSSGLPRTKFFVQRIAFYMRQNMLNGWEAPKEMIIRQVKNERQAIMSDLAEGATAEQLISLLGDGIINKIRQHDLKQLREKRTAQPFQQNTNQGNLNASPPTDPNKVSYSEVTRRLRDMRSGKFK
jgi:hypothetical protein